MNLKNLFAKLSLVVVLLTMFAANTFAQVYVNNTNGDNLNGDGTAVKPYKTILKGIQAATAGQTIYIAADTYNEAAVTVNKEVLLVATEFNGLKTVTVTEGLEIAPGANKSVSLGVTGEKFLLMDVTNDNAAADWSLKLTSGSLTITSANVVIEDGGDLVRVAGAINATPTTTTNLNLFYSNTANIDAGPEFPSSLGAGDLEQTTAFKVTVSSAKTVDQLITAAGSTLELTANLTVKGNITNPGNIKVGSSKLIWGSTTGGPYTLVNGGDIYSDVTATVGTGILELAGSKNLNLIGKLPNVTIPAGYTGVATITGNTDIYGSLTLNSATLGSLTANTFTINVYGDFARNDNTIGNVDFTTNNAVLVFKGGNTSFDPGASLVIHELQIVKSAAANTLSLLESVVVEGNFTITTGQLALGDNNIRMAGAANQTFTNAGYQTNVTGYIIFENGQAANVITGAGTFSNLDIRANSTVNLGSNISFSGTLNVRDGVFDLNSFGLTFKNAPVTVPVVNFYTNLADIQNTGGGAFAVAAGVVYDLNYYGDLTDDIAGIEFLAAGIRNLNIATAAAGNFVMPQASAITGKLTVATTELLDLTNGNLTLSGDDITHSILGSVADVGANTNVLNETGNNTVIAGSTNNANARTIENLTFGLAADETSQVTNIEQLTNLVVTNGTVTVSLIGDATNNNDGQFLGNLTLTAGALTLSIADEADGDDATAEEVAGNVTLTAGTFTCGSNLWFGNSTAADAVGQAAANIALNGKTLTVVGAYTHTGATSNITGTGKLVVAYSANGNFTLTTPLSVSNLELKSGANTVTLVTDDLTVTDTYTSTSGTLALVGNDFILTGNTFNYTAGTYTAVAGVVVFNGTAMNLNLKANLAFVNFKLDATSLSVNDTGTPAAARTLTVATDFTQTAGDVALGKNNLVVANDWTRTAGNYTQGTGYFIFDSPGTIKQGDGWSIDNLKVQAGAALMADKPFTVNKNIVLADALNANTTANFPTVVGPWNLTLTSGITIERQDNIAILTEDANFPGVINLKYTTDLGGIVTTNEVPSTASVLNDVLVEVPVQLAKDFQVNGILTVSSTGAMNGTIDALTNTKKVKMAVASTAKLVDVDGGTAFDQPLVPAGKLNVHYVITAAANTTTNDNELGDLATSKQFTIGTFTVESIVAQNVILHQNQIIGDELKITGAGDFDLNAKTLTLNGNFTQSSTGDIINTNGAAVPAITFGGATDTDINVFETWTIPATYTLSLNKTNATNSVTLKGGNLDFAATPSDLDLAKGLFNTDGTSVIILKQGNAGGQPTQGYTRTSGVITGNVRKFVDKTDLIGISKVTFPTGAATGKFRPATIFFKTAPQSSVNLTVNHDTEKPYGSNGIPLTAGTLTFTNYSPFFWFVKSDIALAPSYKYDLELGAEGYTDYILDQIQNTLIMRRDSGSVANEWRVQGTDKNNYDNSTIAIDFPVVKVIDAQGGVTAQGSRFAYSQLNKKPVLTTPADVAVDETDPVTVTWAVSDPDLGQTPSFVGVTWAPTTPANATFTNGVLTWTPTYAQAGTYTATVTATDGILTSTDVVTIVVANKNQAPAFTTAGTMANATIPYGTAYTFTYAATDADAEALTYSTVLAPVPAGTYSISNAFGSVGLFTFTPTFADNGKVFVVTTTVTDGINPVTTTANLTVGAAYKRGDANTDGVIDVDDAIAVLKFKVNPVANPLTAEQQTYANAFGFDGVATDVTTYDAAFILRYLDSGISEATRTWPVSKVVATAGTVEFGKLSNVEGKMVLPFTLANTTGVNSIFAEADLGSSNVDVKAVQSRLPQDWYVVTSIENGKVRIAAAGLTALKEGTFASIELTLSNKEAVVSVNGNALLNDDVNASLNAKVREIPSEFALSQNYPNPFNPTTSIKFSVAQDAKVNLVVYDMLGQRVRTLVDGIQEAGFYTVRWDGSNDFGSKVASGIYIYRLQAGSFVSTMKMNLMK
ncbi:MAG: FlgD immunoglobulin-like domain containing protein [Melioribacteraceae bacterium]